MRTKYTVINLLVSVGGQLFSILLSFISRMFFIHYLSAEYLGLNGLFTDVLGILNLAELGVEFPVNRYGEYVGYKTDHDPFARAASAGPLTSRFMTEALQKRAAAR